MDPAIQAVLGLGVDRALSHQAAESGLDMRAWAAETVVKIEVAEGRIEIVPPQQADHPAAKPNAFRIAGRASDRAGRLGNFVDALLAVFGGVAVRFLLFRRPEVAALSVQRCAGESHCRHTKCSTERTQQ